MQIVIDMNLSPDFVPLLEQAGHQDVLPLQIGSLAVHALARFEDLLLAGALIVLHEDRVKARALPLRRSQPYTP